MTQRIFDVENEKDMADLWNILPDFITSVYQKKESVTSISIWVQRDDGAAYPLNFISILWHDKIEITRPIQEATEQDIGKICAFWDGNNNGVFYGKLFKIDNRFSPHKYQETGNVAYIHCRRLTKQEIEELC